MTRDSNIDRSGDSVASVYLLGTVDYDVVQTLMQRLVFETSGQSQPRLSLLLSEHPSLVTIGRKGSRGHVRWDDAELSSRQVPLRWVNRGGGVLMHTPGQLAVYPILSLEQFGLSVGGYLEQLRHSLVSSLEELRISVQAAPSAGHGIWGRSGQLVDIGVAVKHWTTYHGAFINVRPIMQLVRRVDTDRQNLAPMSCLAAEGSRPPAMSKVRSSVMANVTSMFGCEKYHVYTGHPWLAWAYGANRRGSQSESIARAG